MGQEVQKTDGSVDNWDRFVDFIHSPYFKTTLGEASKNAIEHTLVRLGFRMHEGANEIQEDMLFLRRLRQGDGLKRLERMEFAMAEHEKQDERRQKEILDKLNEAKQDRELVHKRVSDLKTSVDTKIDEITGKDGPLDELRKDNRNAVIFILGVALTVIGALLLKYVLP